MPESQPQHYFFAGGGTGGHIYPALAVADVIRKKQDDSSILFFSSSREIDARILSKTSYEFFPLPAVGLSRRPKQFLQFLAQFIKSYYFVKQVLQPYKRESVVVGTGGFVAAPVVMAARSLKIPVYLINVDSVPGRANRILGRFAERIFTQFEDTSSYFKKENIQITGCPLRAAFQNPDKHRALSDLGFDEYKKIVLITGASSGSMNINNAVLSLLSDLDEFADEWQIIHLTGYQHINDVREMASSHGIAYQAIDYYDDMPSLLVAADIVVGRAGAVSVAEYAAAGKPAICIPYPYHKDLHQYKNAQKLVDIGAGILVEDDINSPSKTSRHLAQVLKELMANSQKRAAMAVAARNFAKPQAAEEILQYIISH